MQFDNKAAPLYKFGFPRFHNFHKKYMGVKNMEKNNEGFKNTESQIFKFEKIEDKIQGKLISKEDSDRYNNKNYKIKKADGETVIVFGTSVMDSQMEIVNVGDEVIITYKGERENKKPGQNPIKLFCVQYKESA